LYLPSVVIVSYYFEKRRALATGIAVCGAGVGTFIFAPLGRLMLTALDWKNGILLIAGITAQGCAASFLFRPIESYQTIKKTQHNIE
jgi:MCP family monocarboxylic acid transporter-like MFS transporter 14